MLSCLILRPSSGYLLSGRLRQYLDHTIECWKMSVGYLVVWSWLLVIPSLSFAQNTQNTTQNSPTLKQNRTVKNHICYRTETVSVRVAVPLQEPATFRSYTWCLKVPPRCSKYTVIMRERITYQTEVRNQTVSECCPGHVALYDTCVPTCSTCDNMQCDKGTCSCKPGYVGPTCNQTCEAGTWGDQCSEACVCRLGEDCDPVTGNCSPSTSTTTTTSTTSTTTTIRTTPATSTITIRTTPATSTTTSRTSIAATSSTNIFINLTPTEQSSSAEDLTEFNVIRPVDNDIGNVNDNDDYPILPTDNAIVVERSDSVEVNARWISELSEHSEVTLGSLLGLIVLLIVTVSVVVRCRGKKQFGGSAQATGEKNSLHLVARNSHYAIPGPPSFSFLNGHPLDLTREVSEDTYDHPRSIRCLENNEPVYDELRY